MIFLSTSILSSQYMTYFYQIQRCCAIWKIFLSFGIYLQKGFYILSSRSICLLKNVSKGLFLTLLWWKIRFGWMKRLVSLNSLNVSKCSALCLLLMTNLTNLSPSEYLETGSYLSIHWIIFRRLLNYLVNLILYQLTILLEY